MTGFFTVVTAGGVEGAVVLGHVQASSQMGQIVASRSNEFRITVTFEEEVAGFLPFLLLLFEIRGCCCDFLLTVIPAFSTSDNNNKSVKSGLFSHTFN